MVTGPCKVLVVDDSAFHRQMIIRILERSSLFQVIGEAANGGEAIKEVILKTPDVITLDLEMPGMDGFTFLRWLMFAKPTRTLVVSSRESNRSVFKALDLGAVDFMVKPVSRDSYQLLTMEKDLVQKLIAAANVDLHKLSVRLAMAQTQKKARPAGPPERKRWGPEIRVIMIAASTGGPPAIQTILQALPDDFPVPICICQHMPQGFTGLFAKRLAGISKPRVKEAENHDLLSPGVYIAPGGQHMVLQEEPGLLRIRIVDAAPEDRYSPSADRLLASGAAILGRRGVGVVLTGMGDDGINGLAALKQAGGMVVAEDEATCVVYGMPRVAIEQGLADKVLPLQEIAPFLISLGMGEGRGGKEGQGTSPLP
jgi:two-component system chemotaxis response regulator CheB